ncbi:hypothetical protein [Phormidesmis sp. 146-33]
MSSIEQCRGVESFEFNTSFVIVKAPIQAVASAFTQIRQAKVWQQDVYDREIEIVGQDFIVFQFPSHEWTLIDSLRGGNSTEQDAEALAKYLNTESIYYLHSDTGCCTMYRVYDSTGMVESLSSERDTMPYQFQSKRQQLSMEEIGHPAMFTDSFMEEQGVYIPALFLPKVAVGQHLVLKIEAHIDDSTYPIMLDRSDFQRLDHIGIGRS